MTDWTLSCPQVKPIKVGARVINYADTVTFQLVAALAVTATKVRAILAAIRRLRALSSLA